MATTVAGIRTESETERLVLRLLLTGFFTFLTALGARVGFPMWPYSVPQTLQTLIVILAALHLGPRWGTGSMVLYVLIGLVGGPVFSDGQSGPAVLIGQTGGYIIGFILSQPVVAWCVRRRDGSVRGWGGILLASLLGHAVVFLIGVPWLYVVRHVAPDPVLGAPTWSQALYGGFVVFLPGTVLKTIIAVLIARMTLPWAMRRVW